MAISPLSLQDSAHLLADTVQRLGSRLGSTFVDGGVHPRFSTRNFTMPLQNGQYIEFDTECVLEQEPLMKLASEGQLGAYKHSGFWQPMDTFRESIFLNDLWKRNNAPWRNWN